MFTEEIDINTYLEICKKVYVKNEDFMKLIHMLNSSVNHYILLACVGFRKMVSLAKNPPIQTLIDANLLPVLLDLLMNKSDISRIQFEILWTLTNVASGSEAYV